MANFTCCSIGYLSCLVISGLLAIGCSWDSEEIAEYGMNSSVNQERSVTQNQKTIEWSDFSAVKLSSTISDSRSAIVYVGYPFSFPPEWFSRMLGAPLEDVDYFKIEVEWSEPSRGNPFYADFGMSKDGAIYVVFPDGKIEKFEFREMEGAIIAGSLKKEP